MVCLSWVEQSGTLTARHPQGAVWFLQVNAGSFRALAQYCLVLPLLLLPSCLSPSQEPQRAVPDTRALQLPLWNTSDSELRQPFTQPKLGA